MYLLTYGISVQLQLPEDEQSDAGSNCLNGELHFVFFIFKEVVGETAEDHSPEHCHGLILGTRLGYIRGVFDPQIDDLGDEDREEGCEKTMK